jgi:hypothetical protein
MSDMSEEEFAGIDQFVQQKSLVEPVISAQNLFSIYQCPDQQMYRARIQFLFSLDQYCFDEPSRDALIDMLHGAILFGSDNDFSYPKAIVFLSIYMTVFQLATSSPFYLPNELFRRYERILLAHAIDRPPSATLIFELADIKLINDFFINTFFRNVKLIINSFTQKQFLVFKTQFPVKVPLPDIPPLADMEMLSSGQNEEEGVPTQASSHPRDEASEKAAAAAAAAKAKPPGSPRAQGQQSGQAADRASVKGTRDVGLSLQMSAEGSDLPEDRGPEIPIELLKTTLTTMHEKFVSDFEDRERQLLGKIKELEIRLLEKPQLMKKPPPKKK